MIAEHHAAAIRFARHRVQPSTSRGFWETLREGYCQASRRQDGWRTSSKGAAMDEWRAGRAIGREGPGDRLRGRGVAARRRAGRRRARARSRRWAGAGVGMARVHGGRRAQACGRVVGVDFAVSRFGGLTWSPRWQGSVRCSRCWRSTPRAAAGDRCQPDRRLLTVQEGARAMVAGGTLRGAIVVVSSTNCRPCGGVYRLLHGEQRGGRLVRVGRVARSGPPRDRIGAVVPGNGAHRMSAPLTEDATAAEAFLRNLPLGRFAEPEDIAAVRVPRRSSRATSRARSWSRTAG